MLWGTLILVLVVVVSAGTWSLLRERPAAKATFAGALPRLPIYSSVPNFSLIERSGRQVERSALQGKTWIVNFIYTHCADTCPLESAEMAQLQADLAAEKEVRLVSITVDPGRDSPGVLSRYADRFGADPDRWLFLTGEKQAIYHLVQEGFRLSVIDPGEEVPGKKIPSQVWPARGPTHSARFVLVDRLARVRGYYDSSDTEALRRLRQGVRSLLQSEGL
jgi:cytochrome oxidase Cu insertion factor (SCO1/SenC/PrrC family)